MGQNTTHNDDRFLRRILPNGDKGTKRFVSSVFQAVKLMLETEGSINCGSRRSEKISPRADGDKEADF